MTDRELLEQILAKVNTIDKRLENVESDVAGLKSDVAGLKSDVAGLKSDVSTLKSDVSDIKTTVHKHHDMTLEFYVHQQEKNTEIMDKLEENAARTDIYENQTVKNTAALNRIRKAI